MLPQLPAPALQGSPGPPPAMYPQPCRSGLPGTTSLHRTQGICVLENTKQQNIFLKKIPFIDFSLSHLKKIYTVNTVALLFLIPGAILWLHVALG